MKVIFQMVDGTEKNIWGYNRSKRKSYFWYIFKYNRGFARKEENENKTKWDWRIQNKSIKLLL